MGLIHTFKPSLPKFSIVLVINLTWVNRMGLVHKFSGSELKSGVNYTFLIFKHREFLKQV